MGVELVDESRISEFEVLVRALGVEDAVVIGDVVTAGEKVFAGCALCCVFDELVWPLLRLVAELGCERHLAGDREDAISLIPVYLCVNEAEERWRKRAWSES